MAKYAFTICPFPSPFLSSLAFNSAVLRNLFIKFISVKRLHEWSYASAPSQATPGQSDPYIFVYTTLSTQYQNTDPEEGSL